MATKIQPPPTWAPIQDPAWIQWFVSISRTIEDSDVVAHEHANKARLDGLDEEAGADQASVPASGFSGLTIGATYSQAEVDALRDQCTNLATLVNAIRSALIANDLIKGSA